MTDTTPDLSHLIPMPIAVIPAAAIFDCDGTLADTMPLHYRAWRETLNRHGLPHIFPEDQFYAWGGTPAKEILDRLIVLHDLSMDAVAVAHEQEEDYFRLVPELQPIPLVVEEAKRLYGKCPLAVASGGARFVVERSLDLLGIRHLFSVMTTSDDVEFGKPAPDVFLLAAERLGVEPTECVVYEDAPAGLEAARRAGMKAVDITRYL
jgi:HAD superfamily hydrolase (TIGR01509 family)